MKFKMSAEPGKTRVYAEVEDSMAMSLSFMEIASNLLGLHLKI